MKIELQNPINYHISPVESRKQPALTEASSKPSQKFDAIMIHAEHDRTQEQQFAATLTSRLVLELRQPANAGMLQDLQQQIQAGTYEVDVNAIVDKMMLY